MSIDIIIVLIMLFSIAIGIRKGFAATVFHTCGWLGSVILALIFSSPIRSLIYKYTTFYDKIYISVTQKIQNAASGSLKDLLLIPDGFSDFMSNTADILSAPVINAVTEIIYYVICFLVSVILIKILLYALFYIFSKKHTGGILGFTDSLIGGVIGIIRGVILIFLVLILLFPAVSLMSDSFADSMASSLENSRFAFYLYENNPFTEILNNMSNMYITDLLSKQ